MSVSTAERGGIWSASEMLPCLLGRWRLDRKIDGHGSMRGTASFELAADGWVDYREAGELRLADGQQFDATRHYRYQARPAGFAVFFHATPARLFHEVALERTPDGGLRGAARHLCAPDLYLTEYLFLPDGRFAVRHEVRGPRKDFTIATSYRRLDLEPAWPARSTGRRP